MPPQPTGLRDEKAHEQHDEPRVCHASGYCHLVRLIMCKALDNFHNPL